MTCNEYSKWLTQLNVYELTVLKYSKLQLLYFKKKFSSVYFKINNSPNHILGVFSMFL